MDRAIGTDVPKLAIGSRGQGNGSVGELVAMVTHTHAEESLNWAVILKLRC